jgi:COP9 signalosome complex subunit 6
MEASQCSIKHFWYRGVNNVRHLLSRIKIRIDSLCIYEDKQVFPSLELIGWYTVSTQPTPVHVAMIPQFATYTQNPLLLLLHPSLQPVSKAGKNPQQQQLPLTLYEPTLGLGTSRAMLIRVEYKVETGEAERIAVDWSAKGGAGGGSCTYELSGTRASVY